MSSSTPYEPHAGWSWPDLADQEPRKPDNAYPPGAFGDDPEAQRQEVPVPDNERSEHADGSPKPQRHYPPRTCRICLEEVLPSFEPMPEGVTSMFNPAPKVTYISSDPESGRLIRPCKCRGSQAYVHEGCLQEWRHADPAYGRRTFWECPTCKFQYRLERMKWSRWLTSTTLQIIITITIMLTTIFVFGFIADPIINLYLDPYDTITSTATGGKMPAIQFEDEDGTWAEHFLKGLASLGLLGFVKVFFAMSPWHWWNLRQGGFIGGGGGRRGGTGRERMENISWTVVVIGVITFLYVSDINVIEVANSLTFKTGSMEMGTSVDSQNP
jgi:hypothetical protein